jgi:hypothetical protein
LDQIDAPAVGFGDGAHDGQAETRATPICTRGDETAKQLRLGARRDFTRVLDE